MNNYFAVANDQLLKYVETAEAHYLLVTMISEVRITKPCNKPIHICIQQIPGADPEDEAVVCIKGIAKKIMVEANYPYNCVSFIDAVIEKCIVQSRCSTAFNLTRSTVDCLEYKSCVDDNVLSVRAGSCDTKIGELRLSGNMLKLLHVADCNATTLMLDDCCLGRLVTSSYLRVKSNCHGAVVFSYQAIKVLIHFENVLHA